MGVPGRSRPSFPLAVLGPHSGDITSECPAHPSRTEGEPTAARFYGAPYARNPQIAMVELRWLMRREAAAARALAEKQAAEKALAEKLANDKATAETAAKQAAEKQASADAEQKVAAIAPSSTPPAMSPQETTKLVQSELRRVGCLAASADGDWNASSQRSLALFNKHAGTKFDAKLASFDALDAIKAKPGRVCPLVCERGFKADGDTCVKITCRAGYRVNDDNECEKMQDKKPVAKRDDAPARDADRKKIEAAPSKPQSSGQIVCGQAGCRPVRPGCRLELNSPAVFAKGNMGGYTNVEVCN